MCLNRFFKKFDMNHDGDWRQFSFQLTYTLIAVRNTFFFSFERKSWNTFGTINKNGRMATNEEFHDGNRVVFLSKMSVSWQPNVSALWIYINGGSRHRAFQSWYFAYFLYLWNELPADWSLSLNGTSIIIIQRQFEKY